MLHSLSVFLIMAVLFSVNAAEHQVQPHEVAVQHTGGPLEKQHEQQHPVQTEKIDPQVYEKTQNAIEDLAKFAQDREELTYEVFIQKLQDLQNSTIEWNAQIVQYLTAALDRMTNEEFANLSEYQILSPIERNKPQLLAVLYNKKENNAGEYQRRFLEKIEEKRAERIKNIVPFTREEKKIEQPEIKENPRLVEELWQRVLDIIEDIRYVLGFGDAIKATEKLQFFYSAQKELLLKIASSLYAKEGPRVVFPLKTLNDVYEKEREIRKKIQELSAEIALHYKDEDFNVKARNRKILRVKEDLQRALEELIVLMRERRKEALKKFFSYLQEQTLEESVNNPDSAKQGLGIAAKEIRLSKPSTGVIDNLFDILLDVQNLFGKEKESEQLQENLTALLISEINALIYKDRASDVSAVGRVDKAIAMYNMLPISMQFSFTAMLEKLIAKKSNVSNPANEPIDSFYTTKVAPILPKPEDIVGDVRAYTRFVNVVKKFYGQKEEPLPEKAPIQVSKGGAELLLSSLDVTEYEKDPAEYIKGVENLWGRLFPDQYLEFAQRWREVERQLKGTNQQLDSVGKLFIKRLVNAAEITA